MTVTDLDLPGVKLIAPVVHRDDRGFFLETYHQQRYAATGIPDTFVQDNHSRSVRGTLRGLHMQRTKLQAKLVRVIAGEIFDVAVDVRAGSPTFGNTSAARSTTRPTRSPSGSTTRRLASRGRCRYRSSRSGTLRRNRWRRCRRCCRRSPGPEMRVGRCVAGLNASGGCETLALPLRSVPSR
jgi:hypothetical protein